MFASLICQTDLEHMDFERKQITEMGEWCLGLSHVFEFVILFHSFSLIVNAITIWGKKNVSQLTYLTIHSLLFLLSLKWAHFWGYFKHLILQSLCFPIYRRINKKMFHILIVQKASFSHFDYIVKAVWNLLFKYTLLFSTLFYKVKVNCYCISIRFIAKKVKCLNL